MEVKTVKSALEREIVRRDTEGDEVKQLQGQLDIVMNKLKDSKVIYEKIMTASFTWSKWLHVHVVHIICFLNWTCILKSGIESDVCPLLCQNGSDVW